MKRLRLSIFRSNKYIYAQIIDDESGHTLVAVSEKDFKEKRGTKKEKAKEAGKILAQKAKKHKIVAVVFDRGRFAFRGRVKALAEGAREGGLEF